MTYVVVAARFLVGAVFVVAAAATVGDRRPVRRFLTELPGPRRAVPAALAAAVTAEAATAALLLVPVGQWGTATGFVLALALLVAFSAVLGTAMRLRVGAPCGCLGSSDRPVGPGHLVRNGVLATVAAIGLAGSALAGGATEPALVPGPAVLGVAAAVVLVRFPDIKALFVSDLRERR